MEQFNTVGRWKLDKTLGQGSYGVVKRANHAHTQARVSPVFSQFYPQYPAHSPRASFSAIS
jgi:hypothetical protein